MRQTVLAAALLGLCTALPAAADPFWSGFHGAPGWQVTPPPLGLSQSVESRFGVVSWRDPATGQRMTEPMAGLRYRINWGHETDAGWRLDFSVELQGTTNPFSGHGHHPGLTLPRR